MVVNHHLLASDLAVRESGFGEVIPRYEALIIDEAHGFEDAVTQHFGFHVSQARIMRMVRDARIELAEAKVDADRFRKGALGHRIRLSTTFLQFSEYSRDEEPIGRHFAELAEIRDVCAPT